MNMPIKADILIRQASCLDYHVKQSTILFRKLSGKKNM